MQGAGANLFYCMLHEAVRCNYEILHPVSQELLSWAYYMVKDVLLWDLLEGQGSMEDYRGRLKTLQLVRMCMMKKTRASKGWTEWFTKKAWVQLEHDLKVPKVGRRDLGGHLTISNQLKKTISWALRSIGSIRVQGTS